MVAGMTDMAEKYGKVFGILVYVAQASGLRVISRATTAHLLWFPPLEPRQTHAWTTTLVLSRRELTPKMGQKDEFQNDTRPLRRREKGATQFCGFVLACELSRNAWDRKWVRKWSKSSLANGTFHPLGC